MIKYLYVVLIVMSLALWFLWHNNNSLRTENANLQTELDLTKNKLKDAIDINKHITQYNKELAQTINNYKIESQDLQGKLSKFELKANKISKHPKMLENRINKGTQEVNHCFEQISKGEEC